MDFLLNVVLFLPLGAAAEHRWGRVSRAILLGVGLSLAVEFLQATVIPGRDPSARDVMANSLGAALGAGLAIGWTAMVRPSRNGAAALTIGWASGLTFVLVAAALLFRPSAPTAQWFGQHRAELGGFDQFPGSLIDASLAGAPLPSGPLDRPALRHAQGYGYLELGVTAVTGGSPTARIAPIVSVFDHFRRMIGLIGQLDRALVFAPRTRAEDWGFRGVVARFQEVDLGSAADTVRILATYRGGVLEVRAGPPGRASVKLDQTLGPKDWWRLVTPTQTALTSGAALAGAALLLLLTMAPIGWYGRHWVEAGGPALAAVAIAWVPAAVALVPLPMGYPAAAAPVWIGVLIGWTAGWGARGAFRRAFATASGHQPPVRSPLQSR